MKNDFKIKFYGARGTYPVSGRDKLRYGGNTPCVYIEVGGRSLIFDAGTGIIKLGEEVNDARFDADIFITHMHHDHISGLPYFKPFFNANNKFKIYSEIENNISLETELEQFIINPMFPYKLCDMNSTKEFNTIHKAKSIIVGDGISIDTISNAHPGGGLSYKLNYDNKAVCYITDNEITEKNRDELIQFIEGANIAIIDSTFTKEEYRSKKGWGHSIWEDTVMLAKDANIKKLFLFHHEPTRTDRELDAIQKQAKNIFKNTYCAREGESVLL